MNVVFILGFQEPRESPGKNGKTALENPGFLNFTRRTNPVYNFSVRFSEHFHDSRVGKCSSAVKYTCSSHILSKPQLIDKPCKTARSVYTPSATRGEAFISQLIDTNPLWRLYGYVSLFRVWLSGPLVKNKVK